MRARTPKTRLVQMNAPKMTREKKKTQLAQLGRAILTQSIMLAHPSKVTTVKTVSNELPAFSNETIFGFEFGARDVSRSR